MNAQLELRKTELPGTKEIKYYVKDLRAFLEKEELPERRHFIRSFVKEVKVFGGEVTLTYTVPMPPNGIRFCLLYSVATPTGFEPAISGLTGRYVKPLHHGAAEGYCVGHSRAAGTAGVDPMLFRFRLGRDPRRFEGSVELGRAVAHDLFLADDG